MIEAYQAKPRLWEEDKEIHSPLFLSSFQAKRIKSHRTLEGQKGMDYILMINQIQKEVVLLFLSLKALHRVSQLPWPTWSHFLQVGMHLKAHLFLEQMTNSSKEALKNLHFQIKTWFKKNHKFRRTLEKEGKLLKMETNLRRHSNSLSFKTKTKMIGIFRTKVCKRRRCRLPQ